MRRHLGLIRATLLPFAAIAACDSSDDSPSTFNATASDETVASSLTDAQRIALCEEAQAFAVRSLSSTEMKRMSCYALAAAFSNGDSAACEQTAQACIAAPADETSTEETDSCNAEEFKDCSATIAEIEACVTATVNVSKELASAISCTASEASLAAISAKADAACAAAREKCPGSFDDGGAPAEDTN
jgi:hypothetical protein